MAPNYKQMNTAQRSSRKALIGQVSTLLAKRKKGFPGTGGPNLIPPKPTGEVRRPLPGGGLYGRVGPAVLGAKPKRKSGIGARYLGS